MDLMTQIDGVRRPDNFGIFTAKQALVQAGARVAHPMSDEFVIGDNNQVLTYNPTMWTRKEVELDFYRSIATCDFHTVSNNLAERTCFVDASTVRGILYSLLKNKIVIVLAPLLLPDHLDAESRRILEHRAPQLFVNDITNLSQTALADFLHSLEGRIIDYRLSADEKRFVQHHVNGYLNFIL